MRCFAEVILNTDAVEIDRPFTYKIPENLKESVKVGQLVKVPFGFRSKPTDGFVMRIFEEEEEKITYKVKEIQSIFAIEPVITVYDIKLIEFLREKYLCKYIDAIRLLIPTGIMKGVKNKSKKVIVFVNDNFSDDKTKDSYAAVMEIIKNNSGLYTKSELINKFQVSQYKLNKAIELGFAKVEDEVVFRYNLKEYNKDEKRVLTDEQRYVVETINSKDCGIILLKGVTGSGKTEVYMRLVEKTLYENKSAIVLVPEISLTPQMIERFKGRFGKDVALFHSKLSDGERYDEWYRIKCGEAKLIVGARSALFLPAENLGLIIIDEEHENTYKSDQNPKYSTKEVAEFIANQKKCKLILGSATPTIETYYRAISGDITLLELTKRVDEKPMPTMEVVDMRDELKSGNKSLFSRSLYKDINDALQRNEQVILFLNRRGFSTFVSCRSCGYVFKCHECDISMTYHKNGYLICHYCGKTQKEPKQCPKCESKYVKFFGAGTQRVEQEVKKYFPQGKVIRMDVDTTRNKDSYEKLYQAFKNGEANILIGTQMISKGLDFPRVTVVGILAADMSINIPDYRSAERSFQIITQVGGRAGRGSKEGKVIVQTYSPEHYSLEHAVNYDYEGFYEKEFTIRALMNYPPFGKILLVNCSSKNEEMLKKFMKDIGIRVKAVVEDYNGIEMLGPIPSLISKIKENYRWQIIIKGDFETDFSKKIRDLLYECNKNNYNDIRISIDINPNSLV